MTEAHGLVERYGENKIVEVTAFTSRPGILTGLPGPNTTTATGPSQGIPPPFTDQARASFDSRAVLVVAPPGRRAAAGG